MVGPTINELLSSHGGYNLLITGHSLGGGTAELVAMALKDDPYSAMFIPPDTDIKCVALAPPPVFRISGKFNKR